ncbi:hypothetical protein JCM10213v2_008426 [Rhodosporidiobolus nylandii]
MSSVPASSSTPTPVTLLHDPPSEVLSGQLQRYFESPERVSRILAALLALPDFKEHKVNWQRTGVVTPGPLEAVKRVHDVEYIAFLAEIYEAWVAEGGSKDAALPETFLRHDLLLDPAADTSELSQGAIARIDTYLCALASARLALEALEYLVNQPELRGAFALCRPPGHHSTPTLCGGYCYLNNAGIAARQYHAQQPASKVAILDIDYHHGNGTSKVFWDDASVLYVSLHAAGDYPWYTGSKAEVGGHSARGTNLNYPLPLGTDNEQYLATLDEAVQKVKNWNPALLIVSLGVDTYILDPLTDFKITLEAYPEMGRLVAQVGVKKTLFLMEGGYCLDAIGSCVKGVLEGFLRGEEGAAAAEAVAAGQKAA